MSPTAYRNLFLLLLCMTSGIVDVIGYLGLGHVFTSNMTGNIVMLGLAIGHAQGLAVLRSGIALIGFVVGIAIAASILGRNKENTFWPSTVTLILGLECLILITFDLVSGPSVTNSTTNLLIVLLSAAMGMQTTAARCLGIAGISTTVLTNNLANVIEDITTLFRKAGRLKHLTLDAILRISAILIYCFGAVIGTVVGQRYPFTVIWVPICILVGIILTVLIRFRPSLLNQK
ncbi:YoaK family protein [Paenibacillus sp. N3.4]|uniref:YoaK family protein n=1 Tax=Paenibacillus sp. N3.4 TaxID=2603222 RepID=UPI0021C34F4F|nr:YoaK family protein [Paenibacillus sp. N3.4]